MGLLLSATLALQLSWLLERLGLSSGQFERHALRVALKLMFLIPFLALKRRRMFSWDELGLGRKGASTILRMAALSLLLLLPVVLLLAAAPPLAGLVARYALRPGAEGATGLFWAGLWVWSATAAFVEELLYRGYALYALTPRFGPARAALISSALFGLAHSYAGPLLMGGTFAAGIGFWLLYLWRRNLFLPIAAHFLLDAGAPLFVLFWRAASI